MNKSILLSIRPEWVCKILNGKKTIEVRKQFPKDYVGWVYIYCSKSKPYLNHYGYGDGSFQLDVPYNYNPNDIDYMCNGKVVARFWCDKVEETFFQQEESFSNEIKKTLKSSCLTYDELWNYVENKTFYKIHISKLEIFDEPRELNKFHNYIKYTKKQAEENNQDYDFVIIKNPPQNYCYVEGEE